MRHMIAADLKRLSRNMVRNLVMLEALLLLAFFMGTIAESGLYGNFSAAAYIEANKNMIKTLSLIIGILELVFLFNADMKAKTVQAVIGEGVSRWRLVLGKYTEYVLYTLFDVLCFFAFAVGAAFIIRAPLSMEQIESLFALIFVEWMRVLCLGAICLCAIYFFQGITVALLLYIALFAKIPYYLVSFLEGILHTRVAQYTITHCITLLDTGLNGGRVDMNAFCLLIGYVVAGVIAAILLFQKKELEF